jgi:hypothetical protein
MTAAPDQRQAAGAKLTELIALLKAHGAASQVVEECEALARAVSAFHMEGIRFRIFNVDRLLAAAGPAAPAGAAGLVEEIRRHLEAAGFHTRSHQAPG